MKLEGSLELSWSASSLIGGRIPPVTTQSASDLCLHTLGDGELTTTLQHNFYCGTASTLGKSPHVLSPNLYVSVLHSGVTQTKLMLLKRVDPATQTWRKTRFPPCSGLQFFARESAECWKSVESEAFLGQCGRLMVSMA